MTCWSVCLMWGVEVRLLQSRAICEFFDLLSRSPRGSPRATSYQSWER